MLGGWRVGRARATRGAIAWSLVAALWVAAPGCGKEKTKGSGGGAAASAKRPATRSALIDAIVALVRKGDGAAVSRLLPKPEEIQKFCPASFKSRAKLDKFLGEIVQKTPAKIAACAKVDWSKAKRETVVRGKFRRIPKGCSNRLREFHRIKVFYVWGQKRVRIRIGVPTQLDGRIWTVMEEPQCSVME